MRTARLDDVCNVEYGTRVVRKNDEGSRYYVYGGGGKTFKVDKYNRENCTIISRFAMSPITVRHVTGKFFLNDSGLSVTVKDPNILDQAYLDRFLFYASDKIYAMGRGSAQRNLDMTAFRSMTVGFPESVEEQRGIVKKLDDAIEVIDVVKKKTEKNLQNVQELFNSELNNVFKETPPDWQTNKLKDVTAKIGSGATPRGGKNSYKDEGVALVRSLNVYDGGFKYKNLAFLDDGQAKKLNNVILETGDVLLNITGASIARCCVIPNEVLPARVNQHVSIIRPIKGILDSNFLHYLLIAKKYKDQLLFTGNSAGSTRQAVTKAQLQNFAIHYPDTDEQKKIVGKITNLFKQTHKLQKLYRKKLENLEELRRSYLKQVFSQSEVE